LVIRPDCHLLPDALARVADHFAGHPECDLLACATVATSPSGARYNWAMAAPSTEHVYRDPFQAPAFLFEHAFLDQLTRDPRYPRPLVAWRKRIGTVAEPAREAGAAIDFDYGPCPVEGGGA